MIDMTLIQNLNKAYNFKIKQIAQNILYIDSGLDEWILEIDKKIHSLHKNISLRHGNWKRNKGKFHRQREFYDLEYAFKSIYDHENRYLRNYGVLFEVQKMFDKLK